LGRSEVRTDISEHHRVEPINGSLRPRTPSTAGSNGYDSHPAGGCRSASERLSGASAASALRSAQPPGGTGPVACRRGHSLCRPGVLRGWLR
jgi:hypothetical protein